MNDGTSSSESLTWPFRRYRALLPKEIYTDAFQWLYISFTKYFNRQSNRDPDSYSDEIKNQIKPRLLNLFPDILDKQTMEKIIYEVELTFISNGKFNANSDKFLNSFDNVMSDDLEVLYFFQDMVSGMVVPKFYTSSELAKTRLYNQNVNPDDPHDIKFKVRPKPPSKSQVTRAYKNHLLRCKNQNLEETGMEPSDDEYETDDQEDFDKDEPPPSESSVDVDPEKDLMKGRNIVYIDEPVEVRYRIDVIKSNGLFVTSPFGEYTNNWMKNCLIKSRGNCELLESICKDARTDIKPSKDRYSAFIENPELGLEAEFEHCGKIYNLLKEFQDPFILRKLQETETNFKHRKKEFYINCGQLLELTREYFPRISRSSYELRKASNEENLKMLLETKLNGKDVDVNCLCSKYIIHDWQRAGDSITDGTFKSSIIDLILKTDFACSPLLERDSIKNIFRLYDYRNDEAHANRNKYRRLPNENDLKMLTDSIELLKEIMKVS